jgi:hypothetical protein
MSYPIPNNYRRSAKGALPAYLKDFATFLYFPFTTPITDAGFDQWRLDLYDQYGNEVAQGIGTLVKDEVSGSAYRFYTTFTIPLATANGIYYMVIVDTAAGPLAGVVYQTNAFKVIGNEDLEEWCYLQYRNSINIFNYNYETLPQYNSVFLEMNLVERQPELELTQYKEATTGAVRSQQSIGQSVVTLEGFMFDDGMHDTMHAVSQHDDILVNGKRMTVKTGWTIETNKFNSQQKGTLEMFDVEYSQINRNT